MLGMSRRGELILEGYDDENKEKIEKEYLIVVIYDIIDSKRRYRVNKLLGGYGYRVQRSAFECRLNNSKYQKMVKRLEKLINQQDLLRVYRLANNTEVRVWGSIPETFEEDVLIL